MTDDYINGFKDGFLSGIDLKDSFKIQIFGMDVAEILKVLGEHKKQHQSQKKQHQSQKLVINIDDEHDVIIKCHGKTILEE